MDRFKLEVEIYRLLQRARAERVGDEMVAEELAKDLITLIDTEKERKRKEVNQPSLF